MGYKPTAAVVKEFANRRSRETWEEGKASKQLILIKSHSFPVTRSGLMVRRYIVCIPVNKGTYMLPWVRFLGHRYTHAVDAGGLRL